MKDDKKERKPESTKARKRAADDDLTQVHKAQVEFIKSALPFLRQVCAYEPAMQHGKNMIESPAVLIEVVQIKPGHKISGGRFSVTIEFAAHCILSMKTEKIQLELSNFAVRMLQIINDNRWGLRYSKLPTDLAAFPGMFSEELGFDSWVASWEQEFHLGEMNEGVDWLPSDLFIGEAPNIGADHKDDYTGIDTAPS